MVATLALPALASDAADPSQVFVARKGWASGIAMLPDTRAAPRRDHRKLVELAGKVKKPAETSAYPAYWILRPSEPSFTS